MNPLSPSSQAESYRRLLQEALESRNNPNDESYDDEKTLVMMNVLKTIEQLVSSAKDKKDLVAEMEKGIVPLLEATIRNKVVGESSQPKKHGSRRVHAPPGRQHAWLTRAPSLRLAKRWQSSLMRRTRSSTRCPSSSRMSRRQCGPASRRRMPS